MALVDINIITRNRPRYLPVLLWSLAKQTFADFRIVLVNDGDVLDDLSIELLSSMNSIVITNDLQLGIPKSRNVALDVSDAEYIFRVDDDHYVDADCLARLVESIQSQSDIGAVGCVMPFITQGPPVVGLPILKSQLVDLLTLDISKEAEFDQLRLYLSDRLIPTDCLRGCFIHKNIPSLRYIEDFSMIGHGEETLFSILFTQLGLSNFINPRAVAMHLYAPNGGCRSIENSKAIEMREEDSKTLLSILNELRS